MQRFVVRQRGAISIVVVMASVLIVSVLVIFANRSLISELRDATKAYHIIRATQAANGGLEWALGNLNAPKPFGKVCLVNEHDIWTVTCEWGDQFGLVCDCAALDSSNEAPLGVGFHVAVSRVKEIVPLPGVLPMLHVSVTGCSVPAALDTNKRCASVDGATFSVLEKRLRFVPMLNLTPEAALTASGPITLPPSGLGESTFGGYVMGAFVSPSALEAGPVSQAVHTPLRDKALRVSKAALRDTAFRVTCDGECSEQLQRAVQSGNTAVWVDGDLQLSTALALGSDDRPVLLWVEGDVHMAAGVSLTGLLLARSVLWNASDKDRSHFRGAMVADGAIAVTGSPVIEWAPEVLSRLSASAGWYEPVPGWTKAN